VFFRALIGWRENQEAAIQGHTFHQIGLSAA
jgi:hypothetical protein